MYISCTQTGILFINTRYVFDQKSHIIYITKYNNLIKKLYDGRAKQQMSRTIILLFEREETFP